MIFWWKTVIDVMIVVGSCAGMRRKNSASSNLCRVHWKSWQCWLGGGGVFSCLEELFSPGTARLLSKLKRVRIFFIDSGFADRCYYPELLLLGEKAEMNGVGFDWHYCATPEPNYPDTGLQYCPCHELACKDWLRWRLMFITWVRLVSRVSSCVLQMGLFGVANHASKKS